MSYIRSHPTTDTPLYQSVIDTATDPPKVDAAVPAAETPPPSLWHAVAHTIRLWQARRRARHELALIDARSLRELGLSPELVEYELRRPFWRPLRDWHC
ncbi:MAG TPA: hypothetical protein VJR58_25625 [Vineibacter sp.]|nr:hypothetical protein [Vineibacter sp.]